MICSQRDTLFENYRELVERLSQSVIRLKTGQRTAAFDALYETTEVIRLECEKARQKLESHRKQHGC